MHGRGTCALLVAMPVRACLLLFPLLSACSVARFRAIVIPEPVPRDHRTGWAHYLVQIDSRARHDVRVGRGGPLLEAGAEIYQRLSDRFGRERVVRSATGASIPAEEAYEMVRSASAKGGALPVVPAEVTGGSGLYWLQHQGIISVNALGGPGASIWLRFKPAPAEVERFGGVPALVDAVEKGLDYVARRAHSVSEMRRLILGE